MSDRLAILIGNGRFDRESSLPELFGPRNDVASLGRLLGDPTLGNFVVFELLDRPGNELRPELERIFALGHAGAAVFLYYAGHVLADPGRGLFLATADTDFTDLKRTALPVSWIKGALRSCRSRSIVVVLDCCYLGPSGDVDPFEVEQQLRRIRADVGPDVHVIASPATDRTRDDRELETESGVSGRLTHCIVEGLATGAADRDGDNRTGARDLNDYLGMRLAERRPLWTGPLEGADPEIVATPNRLEGVDLDAFRERAGGARFGRASSWLIGAVSLAALLLTGGWAGYMLRRGSEVPTVVRLHEPHAAPTMPEDVAVVDDLDHLRSMINLTGWVEHLEPLDGAGPRYAGAVVLNGERGAVPGTVVLGVREIAEMDFGAGVHGFGVGCASGVNAGEVLVELVDGREYSFDVRTEPAGGDFFGFVSRDPVRRVRITSMSARFVAERIYVYAEREFSRAGAPRP